MEQGNGETAQKAAHAPHDSGFHRDMATGEKRLVWIF
jgi:hypothetical protein